MTNPYCQKHQVSNIKHFRWCKTNKKYLCGLCRAEIMHNNYEKNKDKIKERTALYRQNNPDMVKKFREKEKLKLRKQKTRVIEVVKWDVARIKLIRRLKNIIYKINHVDKIYEKYGRFKSDGIRTDNEGK